MAAWSPDEGAGRVDPADLRLSSYGFELPPERIAQTPVEPRHSARLLTVPRPGGPFGHGTVWDLAAELRPGDLLVVNDTRVLKARLWLERANGSRVEVLVLERWQDPAGGPSDWLCLARPARRLRPGDQLRLVSDGASDHASEAAMALEVVAVDPASGGRVLRFPPACVDAASLEPLLQRHGAMPLPPYIRHPAGDDDDSRYPTRYAARPGAVAAPTAGLHLSDALLAELERRGVERASVTLHVGLGTFRPLDNEDLRGLELHSEWVEVRPELVAAVAACRRRGGRVIAVGTTSVRSLAGVAALHDGELVPFTGPVELVIQPGFRFRVVEGLLTNFHLPRSSLLLLVSALIGRQRLLAAYAAAIAANYRFFSYGDAMWIPPPTA
ncbi:MAG: tRNA preQ1(34) S-adenosylmethionine ribosyltransferase-isomerase QueA [Prochlorococcaceae cyanobacterium]